MPGMERKQAAGMPKAPAGQAFKVQRYPVATNLPVLAEILELSSTHQDHGNEQ